MKDKLWFYAAYNHFKINKAVSGVPQAIATDLGIFDNFTTKESYKLSSKDTLVGYYQWGKKQKPLRGIGVTTPAESALAQTSPSWAYNGRWQRTWSNRLFTEVNIGEFGYTFPEQPNVPFATNPPRHDNATGFDIGAGWLNAAGNTGPFVLSRGKPQAFGNLTYFLPTSHGTHDLKFGFEFMNDRSTNTANGTSGPLLYFDSNGAPSQVRVTDYGDPATFGTAWTQASDYDRHYSVYAQDRYAVSDRITLTLGARYDHQRPYYSSANRQPTITSIWQPFYVPGADLLTADNVAPRVGVSWDMAGDSKSVVKAFYGRFYFNFADNLAGADPGGPNYKDYVFNDPNGNGLFDGPSELGNVVNSFGGTSTTVDPNLKNAYTDEFDLSFDRQFWGEGAFRVAYVRKMEKNLYTTINTARIGQYTQPTPVTVNIQNFGTGVVGPQNYTLFDIPSSLAGVVTNQITNIPDSLGGSSWTYDTLEFAVNKRFGSGLFVNASYDYQWRKDLRQAANNSGSPSPSNSNLNSDPIGTVGAGGSMVLRAGVSGSCRAAEHDDVGCARVGAVPVQVRDRRGGELQRPERLAVRADHHREAAQCGQRRILLGRPRHRPQRQHSAAGAPRRQELHHQPREAYRDARSVQRAEHQCGDELQHRQRVEVQPDQRDGGSADVPGRSASVVLICLGLV